MWIGAVMRIFVSLMVPFILFAGILWQKDFATAQKIAKKRNLPIMVFYESHDCSWCKKMLETTFKDPSIIKRMQDIVAVRVFKEEKNFPSWIQSKYTPTIFFLTPDGKEIIRPILGYQNSEYFHSYLDDVQRRKKRFMGE
ncbi:conserved hypothetical protein [Nitratiruptor sp. SB155-2]|nr:conserved hypothetical protein [Nitratiruptor sp. SB155-2]